MKYKVVRGGRTVTEFGDNAGTRGDPKREAARRHRAVSEAKQRALREGGRFVVLNEDGGLVYEITVTEHDYRAESERRTA